MGTVGTVRVVPALGPALSVHVQVGGVSLDVAENPSWNSRGEENRVDESFGDEVKPFPYLRDGDVAAASRLPAVALVS